MSASTARLVPAPRPRRPGTTPLYRAAEREFVRLGLLYAEMSDGQDSWPALDATGVHETSARMKLAAKAMLAAKRAGA